MVNLNVDNPFQSPSILSLCTGMRGLERGIERVIGPTRTIAHVEIEAFICENLVQQMEQGVLAPTPIWTNLKTFQAEQFYGKIHGITGGYPCQPFSHAGLRKGEDDARHLWPFIKHIVKKSRPVWCFFENVEGHLSLGFDSVQKDLRQLGYQVEVGLFSAAEVGAPHRRTRLFILALENSFVKRVRGWSDEQRENWKREIQTSRSSQLEYSTKSRLQESRYEGFRKLSAQTRKRLDNRFEQSSCELAYTQHNGLNESQNREGFRERNITDPKRTKSIIESSRCSSEPKGHNEKLGNSNNQRLSGRNSEVVRECTYQWITRSNGPFDRWPASAGENQFEWEQPRIESRLGFTINGYNYREDLLRMAGNGVVEQTAELAFTTLLVKFGLTTSYD